MFIEKFQKLVICSTSKGERVKDYKSQTRGKILYQISSQYLKGGKRKDRKTYSKITPAEVH